MDAVVNDIFQRELTMEWEWNKIIFSEKNLYAAEVERRYSSASICRCHYR